LLIFSTL